jgi:hypothetical protein
MDLLTRTWRNFWRMVAPDAGFSLGVVLAVLTLEIVGRRQAVTDMQDLCSLVLLGLVGWLVARRHQVRPLRWVTAIHDAVRRIGDRLAQSFAFEFGFDLRGRPPLPVGLPRTAHVVLLILGSLSLVLAAASAAMPLGLRTAAISLWYTGYLFLLLVLWLLLLVGIGVAGWFALATIHDALVARPVDQRAQTRRTLAIAVAAYPAFLFLAYWHMPVWTPLAICVLALGINLAAMAIPSNTDLKFVWRYARPAGPLRAVPWPLGLACLLLTITLSAIVLVLLSSGSLILGHVPMTFPGMNPAEAATRAPTLPHEVMPITTWLGLLLAWQMAGAMTVLLVRVLVLRFRDPARPCRPVLRILGSWRSEQRRSLGRYFTGQGWQVCWGGNPLESTEVCVRLNPEPVPVDAEGPRWPLPATVDELRSEETLRRLQRRNEIQLRRRLMAGLARLFKIAASHRFRRGNGFLIAPHLWFIPGLQRDSDEAEWDLEQGTMLYGTIGEPYHKLFPRCVRHHLYVMLRALQIDMIFVEDGVGFRRFTRVLRMLFEIYDIHGGRRRADELHFTGIPGIRVLIHEHRFDEPFKSSLYPEPDFQNLGRARILHVFKDRGGEEEPIDSPEDITNVPVTSGAM